MTDHAEFLGEMYSTIFPDAPGHLQDDLEQLRALQSLKDKQEWFFKYVVSNNRGDNPQHPPFLSGPETRNPAGRSWSMPPKSTTSRAYSQRYRV